MADQFLLEDFLLPESLPMIQSPFLPYQRPLEGFISENSMVVSNNQNMNKRIIDFLKANSTLNFDYRETEKNRCYRHMISERLRREKEKQGFTALHSILPPRTKIDKNSIVQTATLHLQMLKGLKQELNMRNCELEEKLQGIERGNAEVAKIRLQVKTPSSIDSMVGVLNCLKNMGLKVRTIRSEFSVEEFSAIVEIETKIDTWLIEEAVESALAEVDKSGSDNNRSIDNSTPGIAELFTAKFDGDKGCF